MYFFHSSVGGQTPYNKFEGWTKEAYEHAGECLSIMRDARINRENHVSRMSLQEKLQPPQPPTMDFSDALRALKKGREVSRLVWGRGTATVIRLQFTDDHSKMTEPYLYLTSKPFKDMVPWTPNPIDLMATDWVFYGTEETGRGTGRDSTGVTQRQYDEADGFARDLNTMREGPLR